MTMQLVQGINPSLSLAVEKRIGDWQSTCQLFSEPAFAGGKTPWLSSSLALFHCSGTVVPMTFIDVFSYLQHNVSGATLVLPGLNYEAIPWINPMNQWVRAVSVSLLLPQKEKPFPALFLPHKMVQSSTPSKLSHHYVVASAAKVVPLLPFCTLEGLYGAPFTWHLATPELRGLRESTKSFDFVSLSLTFHSLWSSIHKNCLKQRVRFVDTATYRQDHEFDPHPTIVHALTYQSPKGRRGDYTRWVGKQIIAFLRKSKRDVQWKRDNSELEWISSQSKSNPYLFWSLTVFRGGQAYEFQIRFR